MNWKDSLWTPFDDTLVQNFGKIPKNSDEPSDAIISTRRGQRLEEDGSGWLEVKVKHKWRLVDSVLEEVDKNIIAFDRIITMKENSYSTN